MISTVRRKFEEGRWWLVVVWSALIFLGSSLPGRPLTENQFLDLLLHKGMHLFEYAVLTWLTWRASRSLKISFLFPLLFAMSDELHQLFVPGRQGQLTDWLVDALAVLFTAGWLSRARTAARSA